MSDRYVPIPDKRWSALTQIYDTLRHRVMRREGSMTPWAAKERLRILNKYESNLHLGLCRRWRRAFKLDQR